MDEEGGEVGELRAIVKSRVESAVLGIERGLGSISAIGVFGRLVTGLKLGG